MDRLLCWSEVCGSSWGVVVVVGPVVVVVVVLCAAKTAVESTSVDKFTESLSTVGLVVVLLATSSLHFVFQLALSVSGDLPASSFAVSSVDHVLRSPLGSLEADCEVVRRSVVGGFSSVSVDIRLIVRSTVGSVTTVKAKTDEATVSQLLDAPLTDDAPLFAVAPPTTGRFEM